MKIRGNQHVQNSIEHTFLIVATCRPNDTGDKRKGFEGHSRKRYLSKNRPGTIVPTKGGGD
jgi:hypothetical protein